MAVAKHSEVIGGTKGRHLPLVVRLAPLDSPGQRHPLAERPILHDEVLDRHWRASRSQPTDVDAVVTELPHRYVEWRHRVITYGNGNTTCYNMT